MSHSLSEAELDLVVSQSQRLCGLPLQRIQQNDAHTVALRFMRTWVLLGTERGRCRMLPVADPGPALPEAPSFCMLLRKTLLGSRLKRLSRLPDDRVIGLEFPRAILMAELLDARANLYLVDEHGCLLGSLHQPRAGLCLNSPYVKPAIPDTPSASRTRLRFSDPSEIEALFARQALDDQRLALLRDLARLHTKRLRQRNHIQNDLDLAARAETLRRRADLLLAHPEHHAKRGLSELVLPDLFEAMAPVCLSLNPRLSVLQNAQSLYHHSRRIEASRRLIEDRLRRVTEELDHLEHLRQRLETGAAEAIPSLAQELARDRAMFTRPGPLPPPSRRLPYHIFTSADGTPIYIGRSARDNHALSFRVARGSDLWLHASDRPGCHGLIRLHPGSEPSQRTLLDAATLVAHYSKASAGDRVEITYTWARYIRPVPKAPGKVYVSKSKTLLLLVVKADLDRLLSSRASGP